MIHKEPRNNVCNLYAVFLIILLGQLLRNSKNDYP